MEHVITPEGVRPLVPGQDAAAWHQSAAVQTLLEAIVCLHATAVKLDALHSTDATQDEARDAAALIGQVVSTSARQQYARGYDPVAAPSSGTCAVSILWNRLKFERSHAIEQQIGAEGLPQVYDDGLTQEQLDAAFDRREELDRDALTVEQVVCLAFTQGRA